MGCGICPERLRLVCDYRETTRIYADLVSELSELVGCGLESEVDLLRRSCRLAWETVERARLALSRHEVDHCCDRRQISSARAD